MPKIVHTTERGQITLPKNWREKFDTTYFILEVKDEELTLKPLPMGKTLQDEVEQAWQEYKDGRFVSSEDLMKKYGL